MKKQLKKILDFKNLKNGWYYGKGHGPPQKMIEDAIKIINCCTENKLLDTNAFPGCGGQIEICIYKDKWTYIEIMLTLDFEKGYYYRDIIGKEELDLDLNNDVNLIIKEIKKEHE